MKKIALQIGTVGSLWFFLSVRVTSADFKVATGDWTGQITYLDYTSGKPFTMPANVRISINAG